MTLRELMNLLKKHTKLQNEANKIKFEITELLINFCPGSPLLCELGCLSVTEPSNFEKRVFEELKEIICQKN